MGAVSTGSDSRVHQVTHDRQRANEYNKLITLIGGTWKVQTMSKDGKLQNI